MAYTSVDKNTAHFNTKLYTSTGSAAAITGVGFQPDIVYIKDRTGTGYPSMMDSVRGPTKNLYTNDTAANATSSFLTAFDADGYTLGGSNSDTNTSTRKYVSWNWKGGGTAVSNTDGSITASVSANPTAGISICKWTGTGSAATVGHGLGTKPDFIIIKRLTSGSGWLMQSNALSNWTYVNKWNDRSAEGADATNFVAQGSTTTFSLGTSNNTNKSGDDMIAYVFSSRQGFSKWERYYGTSGSHTPHFIYTGFQPAFVMFKNLPGQAYDWQINDNKRSGTGGFNTINYYLEPNTSDSEGSTGTSRDIQFYSNGFAFVGDGSEFNANTVAYAYYAFGKEPVVSSNGKPSTAY